MKVKDRAKMFSSSTSDKDLQKNLVSKNKTTKTSSSSSSSFCSKFSLSISNFCLTIKNTLKNIWSDKKKRKIFLIACTIIVITLILIIIIVSASSSSSYSGPEFENPDCTGVCSKPYDIQVYTEGILKAKLKDCGYKEDSIYLSLLYLLLKGIIY